jgi:hypothetical protein
MVIHARVGASTRELTVSDEDKAKAENEFLAQADKDREFAEQLTHAKQLLEAAMKELHRKYKRDKREMLREFQRLCKEDPALREAVARVTFDDLMRTALPSQRQ